MSVINTNITSMIGQQNLMKSQSSLQTSMERLSSGLRINSAKDDAAGQAIANRMSSQITGLAQSQRNANDGISVAQTAEGALNQVNENLQRIRELSVQAQNGTNSQDDLTSIQNEIGQRLNEIDRISEETSFNGVKVLSEDSGLQIQVGANDGETIEISLQRINAETLGLDGFNIDGTGQQNTLADQNTVQAQSFTDNGDGSFSNATFNSVAGISNGLDQLEDGGTVGNSTTTYTFDAASNSFTFDETARADASGTGLAAALTPAGDDINTLTITDGSNNEVEVNVDSSGNITRAGDGAQLYFDSATGNLTENNAGGHTAAAIGDVASFLATDTGAVMTIESGDTTYTATTTAAQYDVSGDSISRTELESVVANGTTANFDIDTDGDGTDEYGLTTNGTLQVGTTTQYVSGFDDTRLESTATATIYQNDEGTFTDGLANEVYAQEDGTLTFDDVSDATATEDPLATLDAALNQVDSLRSDLGAIQNRFESAITNLQTNETNLSAARSRIEDADYATEVANMTRAQILQQAGTSVLAQANQVPQSVLSLLG